jgi:hypothetical protein
MVFNGCILTLSALNTPASGDIVSEQGQKLKFYMENERSFNNKIKRASNLRLLFPNGYKEPTALERLRKEDSKFKASLRCGARLHLRNFLNFLFKERTNKMEILNVKVILQKLKWVRIGTC